MQTPEEAIVLETPAGRVRRPAPTPFDERPRFRGRLHQIALVLSVPAGVWLVSLARTMTARFATLVYAVSLTGLYAASTAFHRVTWAPRLWHRMRRLDHSMIFVLIAGSYTPFAVLALDRPWGTSLLVTAWGVAAVGIVLSLAGIGRYRAVGPVVYALYLTLGWMVVVALPQLVAQLGPVTLTLLFAGGVMYTGGFVILALRRPDPVPGVFGYHEVWHALVFGASLCHYAAIALVVLAAS